MKGGGEGAGGVYLNDLLVLGLGLNWVELKLMIVIIIIDQK